MIVAKIPRVGKCVHCLEGGVELTSDHVFPKSWYPDATPQNLEKWQIPSCLPCNKRYSKIEGDLLIRVGLALDPNNAASASIVDAALRALDPNAGREERDAKHRLARRDKIKAELLHGGQIPQDAVIPGLGERWNRPIEEHVGVLVDAESLEAMTEKFVRGLTYMQDQAFIEPPYKVEFFLVHEPDAKEIEAMLDKFGKEYAREPGIVIRRALAEGDPQTALYDINLWQQFKSFATVTNFGAPTEVPVD